MNYKEKECLICNNFFIPNFPSQKTCTTMSSGVGCGLELRRQKGRKQQREYNKKKAEENPNYWKERTKKYEIPEKRLERSRRWYKKNPDYVKKRYHRQKKEIPNFLEHKAKLNRESYYRNKEKRIKAQRARHVKKLKEDVSYKILWTMRERLRSALNGRIKAHSTVEMLGCTPIELKKYLESLWVDGMTWKNHGTHGWHIDHIKPLSSFDLSKPEEQLKASHYTNLQPLWAKENLSKSNKII